MLAPMQRRHLLLLGLIAGAQGLTAVAEATTSAYARRELHRPDGEPTSLGAAAAGSRLLVVVMKSTHCPVCLAQLRRLEQHAARLKEFGVKVVGLSHETHQECARAQQRARLHTVLLSDPNRTVLAGLGLWREDFGHPMPALVIFDRCGAERGRLVGRSPNQRPEPALFELLEALRKNPEGCRRPNA